MRLFFWSACLTLGLLAGAGTAAAEGTKATPVPLPILPQGTITLRVATLENTRLPAWPRPRIERLLAVTARIVADHFGLVVRFELGPRYSVADLWPEIERRFGVRLRHQIFDFRRGRGNPDLLRRVYTKVVARSEPVRALLRRLAPDRTTPADGAAWLVDRHLEGLRSWQEAKWPDGRPVLADTMASEWVYWDALGHLNLPAEVFVTNQPLISAEYHAPAPHAALRGGLTVGSTGYAPASRYGTLSSFSTFAFEPGIPALTRLRGGRDYGPDEATDLAGAYLAHEIGHQLLHLGHPFENPACVMRPAEELRFRDWKAGLDPGRCRLGSEPAMTPGAFRFYESLNQ
ncbi:MAG: hypothetical protein H6907_11515 [Hyphomicrobiales bacterium]|nr:hypothetical protein [Hyphomicrobiales bacterium]MCP5372350.1 hypothetical protein [Hyphomicrobiales bacterium]